MSTKAEGSSQLKRTAKTKATALIKTYFGSTEQSKKKTVVRKKIAKAVNNNNYVMSPLQEIILSPISEKPKESSAAKHPEVNQSNLPKSNVRTFDSLYTDDETDEEDEDGLDMPTDLPPAPIWSVGEKRRAGAVEQTKISIRTLDTFFQCQYEQVDLQELFPTIEKKHLKRRPSSAHWNTPPRFSMLPKY